MNPCNSTNLHIMHDEQPPSVGPSKDLPGDEKFVPEYVEPIETSDGIIIEDGLRRGLLGRHVSLISLASVIGASCFYGFGYALYLSGPLGALIGFGVVGKLETPFSGV